MVKPPFTSTGTRSCSGSRKARSTRACTYFHPRSLQTRLTPLCRSVVTHRVPLEDMPALYAAFDKRIAGVEKVIVDTKFTATEGVRGKGCPPLSRVSEWESSQAAKAQSKANLN